MLRVNNILSRAGRDDLKCEIFKLIYEIMELIKTFIDVTQHELIKNSYNKYFLARTTIFDRVLYKK
jgi:hypothetical protein